jgi:hypothetical protein
MILAIRASSPSRSRFHEHRLTAHLYPGMRCANQSFIHLDDLTDAVARLIERSRDLPAAVPLLIGEQALGHEEVQNITGCALHGGEWTTVRILQPIAKAGARLQEKVLGQDGFIKPWMVEASNDHYVLGIARARSLLDWEPKHSLRDALPKMIAALKRDPAGWYTENKLNPVPVAWYGQRPAPERKHHEGEAKPLDRGVGHGEMAEGHDHMAMMKTDEMRVRWIRKNSPLQSLPS